MSNKVLDLDGLTHLKGKLDETYATAAQGGKADTAYQKPSGGIPATDLASGVQTSLGKADSAYQKPSGGIPKTDLANDVQTSLGKADSAIQDVSGKADRDANAVEGNLAKFDASHNPVGTDIPADNVAQKDGYYESMAVGTAKNLEGRSVVTEEFFERPTGGETAEVANGTAQLMGVKGRSVKYNQLVQNGNFSNGTTGWGASGFYPSDYSASNGVLTITPAASTSYSDSASVAQTLANKIIVGHKYYITLDAKTSSGEKNILARFAGEANDSISFGLNKITTSWKKARSSFISASYANTSLLFFFTTGDDNASVYLRNIVMFDLTALGIDNLTTVEAVEAWLAENWGTMPYYPYSTGAVINNNMTGLESLGFNLLDPTTGKARIIGEYSEVYGNYYGITGTHGTLTMDYDDGTSETITPDSDGKFELEKPGTLTVATPGADCAVFLWWDGTRTEYEDYDRDVANLDLTHIWGKKNGAGDRVRVWPTGAPGLGELQDYLTVENGEVVAKRVMQEVDMGSLNWVKRGSDNKFNTSSAVTGAATGKTVVNILADRYITAQIPGHTNVTNKKIGYLSASGLSNGQIIVSDSAYEDSTAADFKTAVTGQLLYYELATPEVYTDLVYQGSSLFADGTPVTLPVNYIVNNWGVESVLPKNDTAVNTSKPTVTARYALDAVETLDTHGTEIEDLYDKIEELDERKPEKYGSYPAMAVGSAKVLDGDTVQSAEFTFRKTGEPTPVGSGLAMMRQVMGKSLVWNQKVNATFPIAESHDNSEGSSPIYPNLLSFKPDIPIDSHRKIIIAYDINIGSNQTLTNSQGSSSYIYLYQVNTESSSASRMYLTTELVRGRNIIYQYLSDYTANSNTYPNQSARLALKAGHVSDFTINSMFFIDLTLMFGSGNEPTTVAEFEKMYPLPYYAYNAGQIVNNAATGIEVVGFNQWDEEWEDGSYNPTDGTKYNTTTLLQNSIRSKNMIRVFPSMSYFVQAPRGSSTYIRLFYYDATGEFISAENFIFGGMSKTTPANCGFITFTLSKAIYGSTTYNHDICINLSDASRNGQYEPYKKETVELNITTLTGKLNGEGESVTLCSDGAKSAGGVYDEFVVENGYITKFVKRIGQVDLGDLTWEAINYGGTPGFRTKGLGNQAPSCICSKYECKYQSSESGMTGDKILYYGHSSDGLVAKDSTYASSTVAQFKTAMSGVMLNYELAEPMTYILDTPIYVGYTEDADGTEKRLPEDTASVVNAPFAFSVVYPVDVVRQLDEMPQDYDTTASLDALCTALATTLSSALNGTLTITRGSYDATNQKYSFTVNFTPNA